ncbi:MAG: pinensin family lanthipeptide [Bacteroidota bacterium]
MKKKMNLKDLKVESFITKVTTEKSQTVKGGGDSDPYGISIYLPLSMCCELR